MYLKTVVDEITRSKNLKSEDLFKLNEAVFNLLDYEHVDANLSGKIFTCGRKCVVKYHEGNVDENYAFDLRAMLGTLQNQHFFSLKQNAQLVKWLEESFNEGGNVQSQKANKENEKLQNRVAELEKLLGAVRTVFSFSNAAQKQDTNKGGANKSQTTNKSQDVSKSQNTAKSSARGDGKKKQDDATKPPRSGRRRNRGGGGDRSGQTAATSQQWKPKA
eukprot:GEMP01040965.1.p1 GENE.GEMP01040965.1~~GEMP01040965.1.p1  ORF type:complete len:218 (-),score=76.24 GEMP01040965.1:1145-1798(-)